MTLFGKQLFEEFFWPKRAFGQLFDQVKKLILVFGERAFWVQKANLKKLIP